MDHEAFMDEVYEQLLLARLSQKYYGRLLKRQRRWQSLADALLAVVMVVAGALVLSDASGGVGMLGRCSLCLAAVLTVVRPALRLDGSLADSAERYATARGVFLGLERLFAQARLHGVGPDLQRRFDEIYGQRAALRSDPDPNAAVLASLQREVEREFGHAPDVELG